METIAALATGHAPAGVSIIRLSGKMALDCARKLVALPDPMPVRKAMLLSFIHPISKEKIDEGIVLYFQAPASFTGEDVIEFQGHGGVCHVQALLEACYRAGARAAEPGEFSRRAVLNGRISLERAEAMLDIVHAETEASLAAARSQFFGRLGREVEKISAEALGLRAEVEAWLDFPEDIEFEPHEVANRSRKLARLCEDLLQTHRLGRVLREGLRVVFAGAPNAGKSSLFNRLVGEERAIVDREAGTTRDSLEMSLEIDGIPCTLIDTAGIREGAGRVEQQGIQRAKKEIERGGLCLWVIDSTHPVPPPLLEGHCQCIEVWNKCDQIGAGCRDDYLRVSALTSEGLGALRQEIAHRIKGSYANSQEIVITNRRHAELLESAQQAFSFAAKNVLEAPLEIVAYDLQEACRSLDRILGKGVDDSLLDEIFSRFCIGK